MANQQDIDRVVERVREALKSRDLEAARTGLAELQDLAGVFEKARDKAPSPAVREKAEELRAGAEGCLEELKREAEELELDMLDPKYEERVQAREEEGRQKAKREREKATQFLSGMGGPFASLAHLIEVGAAFGAKAAEAATNAATQAVSEVAAPSGTSASSDQICLACQAKNPARAKFCMECGTPILRPRRCAQCNAELGKARFCPECGAKA